MRDHIPARRAVRGPVVIRTEDEVAGKAEEQEGDEPAKEAEAFAVPDGVASALAVVVFGRVVVLVVPFVLIGWRGVVRGGRASGRGGPREVEDAGFRIVVIDRGLSLRAGGQGDLSA